MAIEIVDQLGPRPGARPAMKLPVVAGRECIPVRLLPFLTNWRPISPDVVASLFSKRHPWPSRQDKWTLVSHGLQPDGSHHPLTPAAWDRFDDDLTLLARELQQTEVFNFQAYPLWRQRSVQILPAGVFVWRDEFELQYARTWGSTAFLNLNSAAGTGSESDGTEVDEYLRLIDAGEEEEAAALADRMEVDAEANTVRREGDGELDFHPILVGNESAVVFEGFCLATQGSTAVLHPAIDSADQEVTATSEARAPWRKALNESIAEIDRESPKGRATLNQAIAWLVRNGQIARSDGILSWHHDERGRQPIERNSVATQLSKARRGALTSR